MFKRIFIILSALLILSVPAHALELVRQKNVATYIVVPLVDADGDVCTGAADLDTELDFFEDGSAPDGFADATNEATEIGSTGQYYLSLAQAELNHGYIIGQVKTSTSGCKTQTFLIRTLVGDPLNIATTDDGGAINVTGGAVDTTTAVTNAVVLPTGTGAGQISLSSGAVALQADQAVNMTKIAGVAVATGTAQLGVNVVNWKGSAAAAMTGDAYARLGAPAGASVSVDIAAVKSDTAAILTDTAAMDTANELRTLLTGGTTAVSTLTAAGVWDLDISGYTLAKAGTYLKGVFDKLPTNYMMGSSVQTPKDDEIDAILVDTGTTLDTKLNNLDTKVDTVDGVVDAILTDTGTTLDGKIDTIDGIVDAILIDTGTTLEGHMTDIKGATFSGTTDSLEAIRNRGDAAWITSTLTAQNVWEYTTRILTALDEDSTTIDLNGSTVGGLTTWDKSGYALSADGITAIWDKDLSGYSTASLAGTLLKGAGAAGDPWVTALPGAYTAGQAGYIVGTNLNATVSSRSSHAAADVANLLLTTPANKLATDASGRVTVGSNADKTGYALTQAFPANFSSLAITGAGAVTAGTVSDKTGYTVSTVSDKTGYSLSQAFPSNFSSLSISALGKVTVGTNDDKTGYTVSTVQDKTGYSISGTITTLDGLNDITAADVVTAMETNGSKLDHLWEMTEDDSGVRRLTTNALENTPAVISGQ